MTYGLEGCTCREVPRQGHVESCPVRPLARGPACHEEVLAPRPLKGLSVSTGHHQVDVGLDRSAGMGEPLHYAVDPYPVALGLGIDPEDPHAVIQALASDDLEAATRAGL